MDEKNKRTSLHTKISKIDWLNQNAWAVRVNDSIRAFELSKEAIGLSEEIQYEKGKAEGLRTFGFCHIRFAKYHEALSILNTAYEMFVRMGDIHNQAVIHEYYGIIHRSFGDYATSLEELFKALAMSREGDFPQEETLSLYHLSITYKYLGDLANALECTLKGLDIARATGEKMPESYHLNCIGGIYYEMGRYDDAHDYYQQSLELRQSIGDQWGVAGCYDNIGNIYLQQGNYQEALNYCLKSLEITGSTGDQKGRGNTLFNTGKIFAEMRDYANALDYCRQSLQIRENIEDKKGQAEIYCFLGGLYDDTSFSHANLQQSLDYLHKALALADELKAKDITYKIHQNLSKAYKHLGDLEKALLHYETFAALEKEVNNEAIHQRILNLQITHRVEQSQKEAEIFRLKNVELVSLVEEINQQKEQIQQTLNHLKDTQNQLVQSEKLASLGELTAGIAHEIQNPLNFVTNFSELSIELAQELKEEVEKLDLDKDLAQDLAKDLVQNQEKINHHGKRAASIVAGMLQHSRASTGTKEPTDLNALADEYLRLAYHGLRAKDKSFNAEMVTDFDPNIGKIEVVPQDMGRVLLNLINNAFYAVHQKSKEISEGQLSVPSDREKLSESYSPTVTISTKQLKSVVEIRIRDNGTGIPDSLKAKIFQPFFTTKPTGQGTGLGLSLAYDIVTKGHGGSLKVESTEGEGTEFIIILPDKFV